MKKLIILFILIILFTPASFADSDYVSCTNSVQTAKQIQKSNKEVRQFFKNLMYYINSYNLPKIKGFYSAKYLNADGFDLKTYEELIQKTWKMYPDIKYDYKINNITFVGNTAIVEVTETSKALSTEKVGNIDIKGYLRSISDNIYYLEKINNKWQITSDYVISEYTKLTYGEANDLKMQLIVPQIVQAGKEYTATLDVLVPDKRMFVIGSIGQEKITYPQVNSEEIYRKIPEDGLLERIFRANSDNLNEYTIGSIGITRAKTLENRDIKLVVTGLGYIISRTNIITQKDFSKVQDNGTQETSKSVE